MVVVQERHQRIIKILKEFGFKVETMNEYASIDEIGFNRCLTCPLIRE